MRRAVSDSFSLQRTLWIAKAFLVLNRRMLGLGMVILLLVAVLYWFFIDYIQQETHYPGADMRIPYFLVVSGIYMILGALLVSTQFKYMHKTGRNNQQLTLPVNSLEKLCAAILISIICYGLIAYLIVLSFTMIIGADIWGSFTEEVVLVQIRNNLFWQSIFLFGAAFFRKNQFLSTLAILLVSGFIYAGITNLMLIGSMSDGTISYVAPFRFFDMWYVIYGTIAFMIGISYLRLKTYEVS